MAKKLSLPENRNVNVARQLLSDLEAHPLRSIQRTKQLYEDVRQQLYWVTALSFGYCLILNEDDTQRESFYKQEFWADREYTPNVKYLLSHIFMYAYGAATGTVGKRANEHSRALRRLHTAMPEIKPEDIPEYLTKNGGFSGLLKRQKR